MVYKIADNIWSPLGCTTGANYDAVMQGQTALTLYNGQWGIPEPFCASLFSAAQQDTFMLEGYTRFESLVIRSVSAALSQVSLPLASPRIVFILSTTKADEVQTDESFSCVEAPTPAVTARHITDYFGFVNPPVVVCNACISGVSALILGKRLIEQGTYDYAVVCGADCQSKFIVSGFQSLKALSPQPCRPFDIERLGLNLGEAAATAVLCAPHLAQAHHATWQLTAGSVHNDAYHISTPSPRGEGSYQALTDVLAGHDADELAFISLHGTATMYNDQMESKAVERAGLTEVPVNGVKGYYGHTMGAAGILETLLSMEAVEHGQIIGTRGYSERGVSGKVKLSAPHGMTSKSSFIKLISGFGGCNAALWATRCPQNEKPSYVSRQLRCVHQCTLTPDSVSIDGRSLPTAKKGYALLTEIYRQSIGNYPKFYKMDPLCRLGFVASELLLQAEGDERFTTHADRSIILFNRHSSVQADRTYQASIQSPEQYFPSPSCFVYTLPNIVTGEIALRNHYQGETSFYILPESDEQTMQQILTATLAENGSSSCLAGWVDVEDETHFRAQLSLYCKTENKE